MELHLLPLSESVGDLYKDHKSVHDGDSGLDLFIHTDLVVPAGARGFKIPLGVKCSMHRTNKSDLAGMIYIALDVISSAIPIQKARDVLSVPMEELKARMKDDQVSYTLIPRSSMSKTPLRQSNSVGLIDAGYRGEILLPVDNLSDEDYTLEKGQRICQIAGPGLETIRLKLVDALTETSRGEGGFGSTGK